MDFVIGEKSGAWQNQNPFNSSKCLEYGDTKILSLPKNKWRRLAMGWKLKNLNSCTCTKYTFIEKIGVEHNICVGYSTNFA